MVPGDDGRPLLRNSLDMKIIFSRIGTVLALEARPASLCASWEFSYIWGTGIHVACVSSIESPEEKCATAMMCLHSQTLSQSRQLQESLL